MPELDPIALRRLAYRLAAVRARAAAWMIIDLAGDPRLRADVDGLLAEWGDDGSAHILCEAIHLVAFLRSADAADCEGLLRRPSEGGSCQG